MEACLELLDRGTLTSLQDLGAAGLSSSSSEMASGGQVGLDIDVSKVPLREDDMEPFEIMISESQERMLCVIEPHKLEELTEVCDRWEVRSSVIGEVTDSRHLRDPARRRAGRRHARGRAGGRLPAVRPRARRARDTDLPVARRARWRTTTPRRCCRRCWARPTCPRGGRCSSSTTRSCSRAPCAGPRRPTPRCCACTRRPTRSKGIAVSIDGNGRRVACDPYTGTVEAVLECAANLACVGGEPLGLTNCLNFGNPEKPHVAWQLQQSVAGMTDALTGHRRAGGGRQRVALQRVRRRADLPHAGGGHGRARCPTWPPRRASGFGAGRRPDRAGPARRVRRLGGGLGAGQAARGGAAAGAAGASTWRP